MVKWSYTEVVLVIVLAFFAGYTVGRLRALFKASRR
ncbi:Uncharacterised protein [Burkholderia oklahomensis]|nr:putative membrane protein [Burkholderia oklahomensis C6786]SUW58010.1 Uncharacterised protein [Burkholderia oklahomensis]